MILFRVGESGVHIGCCLNPLEVSFLYFCMPLNEAHQPFEVFLAVAECVGFRAGGRLPFK